LAAPSPRPTSTQTSFSLVLVLLVFVFLCVFPRNAGNIKIDFNDFGWLGQFEKKIERTAVVNQQRSSLSILN
jgi:hypothetical protein